MVSGNAARRGLGALHPSCAADRLWLATVAVKDVESVIVAEQVAPFRGSTVRPAERAREARESFMAAVAVGFDG